MGKDNIKEESAKKHSTRCLFQESLAHYFIADQNKRDVQHKGSKADGKVPQMVAYEGEAGYTAGGKVCRTGKGVEADGIGDAADDITY